MRMYHPKLPYTKKNGGVEVTEKQFQDVWSKQPQPGWKRIGPKPIEADSSFMDEGEE